ncbi:carbamoyltransferase HypF [Marinobacterium sediminicola]|uniref:carbamoyltransferase HypF n=1 Tax=Marinobacterium sediminicola TaxID=518898 RepID=UPI0023B30067|nr:carbamoyltransferase HypF [Marinobacterium sediminicola]
MHVRGHVQGVGFRPCVWRLAQAMGLCGDVCNTSAGVEIRLRCSAGELERFERALSRKLPPQARIESLYAEPVSAVDLAGVGQDFAIRSSKPGEESTWVPQDTATCPECLAELFDPHNRRYRYPFTNCTHCGPRFSLIEALPYDRKLTGMSSFDLCRDCIEEYSDPEDRRFHAQINACEKCGPRLWLESPDGTVLTVDDPVAKARDQLLEGGILALKGLGGFHLCCDAGNEAAVMRLRSCKQRPAKALAVMFPSLAHMEEFALISPEERRVLLSPQAPILLLRPRPQGKSLASSVAPDSARLGCFLPYTPLHHLLLDAFSGPLVMTSGNGSGLPQVIDNDAARQQLAGMADLFLMHNRPIVCRVDDAVVRLQRASAQMEVLRPGRGLAPVSLPLPPGFANDRKVMALGADLKNTFCLAVDGQAVMSQYQGNLQQLAVNESALLARQHFAELYRFEPRLIVCDQHPAYVSTQMALASPECPVLQVQHHHAHLASCLGQHGYPLHGRPVLGICLDGTGYGDNGQLWGGELLYGGYAEVKRVGCLQPVALPGGENAIREPWRVLVAQLLHAGIDPAATLHLFPILEDKPLVVIKGMIDQGFNSPLSSSAGRLFDAVAAALGCYAEGISYEAQAAVALETLALDSSSQLMGREYSFPFVQGTACSHLDVRQHWHELIADLKSGRSKEEIARAFHLGLSKGIVDLALHVRQEFPYSSVVLSGGVMQNELIVEQLAKRFESEHIEVLRHQKVPCNDSGVSLGQLLVALAQCPLEGGQHA